MFVIINIGCIVVYLLNIAPSFFTLNYVCLYLPFFSLGFVIRENITSRQVKEKLLKIDNNIALMIFFVIWNILVCVLYNTTDYDRFLKYPTALVGMICIYIISCKLSSCKIDIFKSLSMYSLQLYLLNGYMLVVSRTVLINIMKIRNPIIIIVVNTFVSLVVSYLIIKYVISKIKLLRIIFGMKW